MNLSLRALSLKWWYVELVQQVVSCHSLLRPDGLLYLAKRLKYLLLHTLMTSYPLVKVALLKMRSNKKWKRSEST